MNTFEQELANNELDQKIELTEDSLYSLDTIWRWTSFFSILGFIFIAILILLGIAIAFIFSAIDSTISPMLGYGIMVIYIAIGALYFYPILLLFRFSTWTRKALKNKSSLDLSLAFKNLKGHFQFVGIMTIVIFALYMLAVIVFAVVKVLH